MEETYIYKVGKSMVIEEEWEGEELIWSQYMMIETFLDILLLDFLDELSQNN